MFPVSSSVFTWYCRLSALCHSTTVFQQSSPWNVLVVGFSSFQHIFSLFVNIFLPSPPLSPLLTQCDGCVEDCVGAGSWLGYGDCQPWEHYTGPGYPRHPSSIQHNAVVKSTFSVGKSVKGFCFIVYRHGYYDIRT